MCRKGIGRGEDGGKSTFQSTRDLKNSEGLGNKPCSSFNLAFLVLLSSKRIGVKRGQGTEEWGGGEGLQEYISVNAEQINTNQEACNNTHTCRKKINFVSSLLIG